MHWSVESICHMHNREIVEKIVIQESPNCNKYINNGKIPYIMYNEYTFDLAFA
jgi:hypothetical protein